MSKQQKPSRRWKNPHALTHSPATTAATTLLLGDELRRRISGGCALGTFSIEISSPASIAALALAGFDFVVLDMEHSPTDFSTLEALLLAAHAARLPALVRPCGQDMEVIGKILDLGAHGIMVPHVDTPERAHEIVEQTRFPPRGRRSFSPLARFDSLQRPLEQLDRATYLVLQIEGSKALDRVTDIAAVDGIDGLFVGPYDLALSLGVEPNSPQIATAARRIARSMPKNIALGLYVDDPSQCGAWAARGFSFQCVSFDGRMFANGTRAVLERARKSVSTRTQR